MATYTNKHGQEIESNLTLDEACKVLERCSGDFAAKLREQHQNAKQVAGGSGRARSGAWPLKGDQIFWAHKIAQDQLAREQCASQPQPQPSQPQQSYAALVEFFGRNQHSATPRVVFEWQGRKIVLQRAGERSRTPGAIQITDGRRYPDNTWYGRIETNGQFTVNRRLQEDAHHVFTFLAELAIDPVAKIREYAHQSGNCCFCGSALPVATTAWGPICAQRWNLPYDNVTLRDQRTQSAQRKALRQALAAVVVTDADFDAQTGRNLLASVRETLKNRESEAREIMLALADWLEEAGKPYAEQVRAFARPQASAVAV